MELPKRKKNRMSDFDYSLCGAYFVTICVKDKCPLLWNEVRADIVRPYNDPDLSDIGKIVDNAVKNITSHYPMVIVDKYVIMPDHLHMVIFIVQDVGERNALPQNENDPVGERIVLPQNENGRNLEENGCAMRAPTISTVINQMKGFATKQIDFSIWQKSFHDHIIRNEQDYTAVCGYIEENPLKYSENRLLE